MLYHVTPLANLPSILRDGLVPSIGARSVELGETAPRIYLFANLSDVEAALMGWMSDAFDEDDPLAIIEIEPSPALAAALVRAPDQFEITCSAAIEAGSIRRVLNESLREIPGATSGPSRPRMR